MTRSEMAWWGRGGIAHHIPILSTMKTACGREMLYMGHDFTRLDPETGEPWLRCKRCVAKVSPKTGKVAAPKESEGLNE